MLATENRNATADTHDTDSSEPRSRESLIRALLPASGAQSKAPDWMQTMFPLPPALPQGEETHGDAQPILAVFCHDEPASEVGQFVSQLAGALAERQIAVHIFSRKGFELSAAGVSIHVLGEPDEGDLFEKVQEFTHRACKAFLKQFPAGTGHITLMGHEWASVPVLSILCGTHKLDAILSLHSLERQRGDMTSDISRRIEEIELAGVREAKAVLVHQPATAEVVKFWVPECGSRIECVRPMFPVQQFNRKLDPGEVKGRYQVGPVDPTILFVGDLSEQYGPDLLVKAMPGILKNHKQARLIVVGEGALYWPLRVYARYLLLEHAVRLVGSVEGQTLNELIQAADIVAIPSRESTPWWPIQAAWAADKPVVATHNAAPTLLEHEQDSVRVYPTENSLVWGIERVLFDAELRQVIADKGRQKLEERSGWSSVAAQVEELMGVHQAC